MYFVHKQVCVEEVSVSVIWVHGWGGFSLYIIYINRSEQIIGKMLYKNSLLLLLVTGLAVLGSDLLV